MIKKSKEERELEKEVVELEKLEKKAKEKREELERVKYRRRLNNALMKILNIDEKGRNPEYVAPIPNQLVEIIFDEFPDLDLPFHYDFISCVSPGVLRLGLLGKEQYDLDWSDLEGREELMRIVFVAVILSATIKVFPTRRSTGSMMDGGGIH